MIRMLTPPVPGSPGSVRAQSTLVFGHGEGTVTSDTAEQQLRNSLNQDGFIRDLQLVDIQSERKLRDGGVRGDGAPWRGLGGGLQVLLHPTIPPWHWGGPRTGCFPLVGSTAPLSWGCLGAVCPSFVAQPRLCSSSRHCGGDVPSTGVRGPRLGHCSAGPGLHPAAAEHPHLLPHGEPPVPIRLLQVCPLSPFPRHQTLTPSPAP